MQVSLILHISTELGLEDLHIRISLNLKQKFEIDETSTPVLLLWFFDSQGGFDPSGIKPSIVDASVVNWFKETSAELISRWGRLPALAYFHIPT